MDIVDEEATKTCFRKRQRRGSMARGSLHPAETKGNEDMIQRQFDAVTKSDIDALVADGIFESKTLEYKQPLPGPKDEDKREFLADVSSFANASGGDIIYGMREVVDGDGKKTGAGCVVPIIGVTADQAKLRLEEMIRSSIEPRMPVQIKEIVGWGDDGQGFVILVRVPKSFNSPHMVTFRGSSRFYSRSSAGKYQLDVTEIRTSFLATESQGDRIRNFLRERIASIRADETPVALEDSHRVVLHIIPTSFFLSGRRLNLLDQHSLTQAFSPRHVSNWRYTLDGFVTISGVQNKARAYCQLMFNGCVELVYSQVQWTRQHEQVPLAPDILRYRGYADRLYEHMVGLTKLGVEPPYLVHAAILGCSDCVIDPGSDSHVTAYVGDQIYKLGKDVVLLPEVILNECPQSQIDFLTMLKPLSDGLFNASGMPRHNGYDGNGKWMG